MSVHGSSGNWDSAIISELLWYWSKKLSHVCCRKWQNVVRFHLLCLFFRYGCFLRPWFLMHIEKLQKFHEILKLSVCMELKVIDLKIHIQ